MEFGWNGLLGVVNFDRNHSFSDRAAMKGASDKFLAQVASLVKIDYTESMRPETDRYFQSSDPS